MSRAAQCPCGSDRVYAVCCGVYHDGASEAPDAEALMRSRYAAFAMRRPEYLWKTLHPDHPDRMEAEPVALARLRRSAESHRYTGLTILDRAAPDGDGIARVLFHARVFSKGRDVSFVECSDFAHDGRGWRYLAGEGTLASRLRGGLAGITIARFAERSTA